MKEEGRRSLPAFNVQEFVFRSITSPAVILPRHGIHSLVMWVSLATNINLIIILFPS